jgi:hypothetical protein
MMRMSHILAGTQFKTANQSKKLSQIINETRSKQPNSHEEDDALTLKSIKRW